MTPNQLPPLSDEQFPDFLTDTDVARIFRHVYGGQQFDSTERMFSAEVEAAVRAKFREALAAIAQQAQEPVGKITKFWSDHEALVEFSEPHGCDMPRAGDKLYLRPSCTTPPAPQVPAPVDELPDLNPEDFVVDVVLKRLGGFAPVTSHGVRVTHKPSHISVVVDSERSQHRNRQLALKALRAITQNERR